MNKLTNQVNYIKMTNRKLFSLGSREIFLFNEPRLLTLMLLVANLTNTKGCKNLYNN